MQSLLVSGCLLFPLGRLIRRVYLLPVKDFISPVRKLLALVLLGVLFFSRMVHAQIDNGENTTNPVVTVEQIGDSGRYQLLRDGRPYRIKGAGMHASEIAVFAAHGGNSLRTWGTGDDRVSGTQLLDEAAALRLTVALCLDLGRERHGFDYDDEEAVARQLEYARQEIIRYKDHPALLLWIIGNELNHSYTNPRVFDAINDISRMIHAVDGNHPTTTALTGFSAEMLAVMETRAPDLDFLSFQLYAGLDELPQRIRETGYSKPFMITEWGATGHWEVARTPWGAPVEMNSSEKAQLFLQRYENVIAANPGQIIGSYVFLLGQKQERTPTWYGMLLEDGSKTESMDVMHYIWTGEWPKNRAPRVNGMLLDGKKSEQGVVLYKAGQYAASMDAVDPDGGDLTYRWEIMRESEAIQQGGDPEAVPESVAVTIKAVGEGKISLVAPAEPGAYRLFAHVYDSHGLAGHANIPFLVESSQH